MRVRRILCFLFFGMIVFLTYMAYADQQITITFTGDCTLGGEEYLSEKEYSFQGFVRNYGYDWFFANVRGIFESDDYTVVNLEGVLSDSTDQKTGKTYNFRGATDYVKILTESSVECVNLANNHSFDFGAQGFRTTKAVLRRAGIDYFAGKEINIYQKGNVRIAFLSCNCFQSQDYAENKTWFSRCIRKLRETGISAIVFTFHAGQEYSRRHARDQINFADFAIGEGCDLVVMHHPHVLQGISVKNNRSIIWSLGNFCFGGNTSVKTVNGVSSLYTAVIQATLTFSDDGSYLGQQLRIYPAHISGNKSSNNFQPILVHGQEAKNIISMMQRDSGIRLRPFDDKKGYAMQDYLPAQ